MGKQGWIALGVVLAAPFGGAHAHAADQEPLPLDWHAADDCPDVSVFRGLVDQRAPHARAPEGRRFVVELSHAEGGTLGVLGVIEASGARSERRVEGRDCRDALEALALITSLLLEPVTEPASAPAEEKSTTARVVEPPRADEWRLFAGALALTGSSPRPLFAGMAGIEWWRPRAAFWSPRLRLAGSWTEERGFTVGSSAVASFQQAGAVLEFCPLDLVHSAPLSLHVCAAGELAALQASGWGTSETESHSVPFGSLGPSVLFGAAVGGAFRVDLRGALVCPLSHDTFVLDGATVHAIPNVAARVGVELSVDLGI